MTLKARLLFEMAFREPQAIKDSLGGSRLSKLPAKTGLSEFGYSRMLREAHNKNTFADSVLLAFAAH
jgi:hypothetical protein